MKVAIGQRTMPFGPVGELGIRLSSLNFSPYCFVEPDATKQFSARRNRFSLLAQNSGNAAWLSRRRQERRTAPAAKPGDGQMRTLSVFLAFAFVLAGASMAGFAESGLPGVGTFAYSGSSIVTSAHQTIVVAAR
jgi:hypothetical protein